MKTVTGLLERLRAAGGTLEARDDQLRVQASEPLPPDLVDALRVHKARLIHHLLHHSQKDGVPGAPGVAPLIDEAKAHKAELEALDVSHAIQAAIDDFATSSISREVRSGVLKERVIFAADNAEVPDDTALVVYQASELQLLDGASPAVLKAVHLVKGDFDGEVVEEDSQDDRVIQSRPLHGPSTACGQASWWVCVRHPQRRVNGGN